MSKLDIQHNYDLSQLNSFGLPCICRAYIRISSNSELHDVFSQYNHEDIFILGGGSNLLLPNFLDRTVVQLVSDQISIISENDSEVVIKVDAGKNWHDFVKSMVESNFAGIENLALIPGSCGAAPVQNIGAYGVEIKDVIESVEVFDRHTITTMELSNQQCEFDYRSSVFKTRLKNRYIILSVKIKLNKGSFEPNISYKPLVECFTNKPSIEAVFDAIISIRSSKLPDPKILGNSGSFFKNPIVDINKFTQIKCINAAVPMYPISDTLVKIPAAWLIDSLGWRGKRFGNVGCYEKQALVIVNYGDATSQEVRKFVSMIQMSVNEKYGIELIPEVNIIEN